ncbi:MutS_V domain-containing protein/MutS_I domain-containing protein/MutS_II domain-containing protein/MutS_III domain-containing protein [Cephalotus follicularis]|uniref:MutS_V domain-containing protein/MutS_I domain-containing protein/MutS_II domain-containing protein/MutS_III domain-containing protein n=1 Tax=Cephalotus follicularis TaxID=3775 RepID=A0A1Q3CHA7_CEPFO|nr:MutS_V domain-containing protein/MutS_I domain-containing protein/MutS_II domain-containing protein/MutS_III domain-containing protein [Cephalotus follicularis]
MDMVSICKAAIRELKRTLSSNLKMERQRSILSFFQKPSAASQNSCYGDANDGRLQLPAKQLNPSVAVSGKPTLTATLDSSIEIRGTDTPPEKVPRQILPSTFTSDVETKASSIFSSILHKFVKVDDRNGAKGGSFNICSTSGVLGDPGSKLGVQLQCPKRDNILNSRKTRDQESILHIVSDDDIPGPETPGMLPGVPRLKRIQEDIPMFGDKNDCSLLNSNKRVKFLQDDLARNKNQRDVTDTTSKFEWLEPSRIRDANGRRPGDPLYDKKTLYIPPDALKKMTASQKQYWSVKCQYMDILLFFKVGKFYELYELDAEIGHKELDWKMTQSGVGKCRQVGISESGIDDAVQKLVTRGYKVGRMEQLETSAQAKARGVNSVISRKLVNVITPSTTIDGNIGPDAVHLLALKEGNNSLGDGSTVYGFAFVDCAALKFWVGSINDDASCAALGALMVQVSPKEVIYESRGLSKEAQKALKKYLLTGSAAVQLTPVLPLTDFVDVSEVRNLIQLKEYFKGSCNFWNNALDSIMNHDIALGALGGLIGHLSRLMLDDVLRNADIFPYQVYRGCLRMDGQTLVNLEIFNNNADGGLSGTLFKYLDSCLTLPGKRLLRSWICHPLKDVEDINNRLNVVEYLITHSEILSISAQYLRKLPDLERLLGRAKASVQASDSVILPVVSKQVLKRSVKAFGCLVKGLRVGMDLLMLLQNEVHIFSLLLKNFKLPMLNGSDGLDKFLTQFEAAIESDFPNYQNHDIADSDAETLSILIDIFIEKAIQWSEVIYAINCIDVLRSFAVTASMSTGAMSRPVILPQSKSTTLSQGTRGPIFKIKGLWHPFALGENGGLPVPNDLVLGEDSDGYRPCTLLLTGPNMGGKSTLLRATCISVILAQLGCFVPSEKCVLSLVDIIFTRLGATDRIMTGESTFFVECTETASVLQNATQDSLVLLDELGRGTSTFDGYALAYAVFRHLIEKVNCRLLFATHYHPLTKEFGSHPHVNLQHMACAFKSESGISSKGCKELVFLYRLKHGACPESYGLQVAIMAGIPEQVVKAASQAGQVMKKSIGESFRSSEQRSEFSTLHEEWLKTLLDVSNFNDDDDAYDTLFCMWHELKSSYRLCN